MICPSCKSSSLKPDRIEAGLPGYICRKCSGSLVSISSYLDWAYSPGTPGYYASKPDKFNLKATDTKHVMSCPKCSRLMLKYRIAADSDHKLDYCFGCEEVWLDGGEWNLLKSKGLVDHVTSISTDAWQRRIRDEIAEMNTTAHFEKLMGPEIFSAAVEFKKRIEGHEKRSEILTFLSLPTGKK